MQVRFDIRTSAAETFVDALRRIGLDPFQRAVYGGPAAASGSAADPAHEIRLAGHVLPDQLAFAIRCGVDRILTTSAEPEEHWRAFANRFDVHYQPALDEAPWAARRRAGTVGWVEVA